MSEEKIFESVEKKSQSSDMVSFDGCPHRCRNGYYVDPYKHKRVRCEHCFELRKKLVKEQIQLDSGQSIAEKLRLAPSMMGVGTFDIETILPESERNRLEDWSVDFVLDVLRGLIDRVSIGETIGSSMLINVGRRSHIQNFISPFLVRSYISGLTTAPRLSALDIVCLRTKQCGELPSAWVEKYVGLTYDAVVASDVCIVYLDAGAGSREERELMAVKGLMQLRALSGKSTIILTDYYSDRMYDLVDGNFDADFNGMSSNTNAQSSGVVTKLIEGGTGYGKDLAQYVAVKYKTVKKQPHTPSRSSTDSMKSMFNPIADSGVV